MARAGADHGGRPDRRARGRRLRLPVPAERLPPRIVSGAVLVVDGGPTDGPRSGSCAPWRARADERAGRRARADHRGRVARQRLRRPGSRRAAHDVAALRAGGARACDRGGGRAPPRERRRGALVPLPRGLAARPDRAGRDRDPADQERSDTAAALAGLEHVRERPELAVSLQNSVEKDDQSCARGAAPGGRRGRLDGRRDAARAGPGRPHLRRRDDPRRAPAWPERARRGAGARPRGGRADGGRQRRRARGRVGEARPRLADHGGARAGPFAPARLPDLRAARGAVRDARPRGDRDRRGRGDRGRRRPGRLPVAADRLCAGRRGGRARPRAGPGAGGRRDDGDPRLDAAEHRAGAAAPRSTRSTGSSCARRRGSASTPPPRLSAIGSSPGSTSGSRERPRARRRRRPGHAARARGGALRRPPVPLVRPRRPRRHVRGGRGRGGPRRRRPRRPRRRAPATASS